MQHPTDARTSRRPRRFRGLLSLIGLAGALAPLPGRAEETAPPEGSVEFNRDIRPILSDACFHCHGPDAGERKADLRLDTEDGLGANLGGYYPVVPGKPERSEIWLRISAEEERDRMPPPDSGEALEPGEIERIRRWIEQGAKYEDHWSFVPPRRPPVPGVDDAGWCRTPFDRFVLARLEERGLRPSPEADPVTLVRRLHFDLVGLPPTPAEVDAFLADDRPGAWQRLVDRLLASPHHGERMALYWLDLVRYADSVGYHGDQEHHATPYRDWVIDAFNANMPFDRFTVEQLAGDLLPDATVDQRIASCYNRLLQTTHEGGAQDAEYLAKYAADRVRNLSGVWMGATVGCAQCHDHKYDPYTQKDFYSLVAFFADLDEQGAYNAPNSSPTRRPPEISVLSPRDRDELAELTARLETLKEEAGRLQAAGTSVDPGRRDAVARERASLEERKAEIEERKRKVMVSASVEPRTIRVLPRGDWMDKSGEVVEPAVPHFLPGIATDGRRATRLDLARWLTSPDHPQTSRVFVNRLVYLFFGRGLSKSLDDTGAQGELPTHPRLLDWLAMEFVESGWDVRHTIRQIVLSSAYRQSSRVSGELRQRDPENRLLGRQGRFRVPAEMVRDTALAVSGLLVRHMGGPSARPYQPEGYYAHLNFPKRRYHADEGARQYRRGVYMHWQRQFLHPMLQAFDAPTREECTAKRPVSNTPLAALTLLNDPSFTEAARVLAARVLREGGEAPEDRVRWAWRRATSRRPEAREVEVLLRLYRRHLEDFRARPERARELISVGRAPVPADLDPAELAAWTSVMRAVLNLNETITRN